MHKINLDEILEKFNFLEKASLFKIILFFTFFGFLGKVVATFLILNSFNFFGFPIDTNREAVVYSLDRDFIKDFALVVIISPILETLIGQTFLIKLVSKYTQKQSDKIVASGVFSSMLHAGIGIPHMLALIPINFMLSWCYVLLLKRSFLTAFVVTIIVHVLHNLLSLLIYYNFTT